MSQYTQSRTDSVHWVAETGTEVASVTDSLMVSNVLPWATPTWGIINASYMARGSDIAYSWLRHWEAGIIQITETRNNKLKSQPWSQLSSLSVQIEAAAVPIINIH